MNPDQATRPVIRARNQAAIRIGGEQGRVVLFRHLLAGSRPCGLSCACCAKGRVTMRAVDLEDHFCVAPGSFSVRIINDVAGTDRVIEVTDCHCPGDFAIRLALLFKRKFGAICGDHDHYFDDPFTGCIRFTTEEITIHYHADGDEAAARQQMEAIAAEGGLI